MKQEFAVWPGSRGQLTMDIVEFQVRTADGIDGREVDMRIRHGQISRGRGHRREGEPLVDAVIG